MDKEALPDTPSEREREGEGGEEEKEKNRLTRPPECRQTVDLQCFHERDRPRCDLDGTVDITIQR
jgi:hypothetical protein